MPAPPNHHLHRIHRTCPTITQACICSCYTIMGRSWGVRIKINPRWEHRKEIGTDTLTPLDADLVAPMAQTNVPSVSGLMGLSHATSSGRSARVYLRSRIIAAQCKTAVNEGATPDQCVLSSPGALRCVLCRVPCTSTIGIHVHVPDEGDTLHLVAVHQRSVHHIRRASASAACGG